MAVGAEINDDIRRATAPVLAGVTRLLTPVTTCADAKFMWRNLTMPVGKKNKTVG
jgi:hypothetical protein